MSTHRLLPSFAALVMACSPSTPILLPNLDAGASADGATDRPGADDSSDVLVTPMDVPIVEVGSVDASVLPDVPVVMDVVPTVDVPPTVDAPLPVDVPDAPLPADVPDVPPTVDAGTCPPGMVLIPAGVFTMGDTESASVNAQPPHRVTVSAFCMDLTEVTVSAYGACTATGCTAPNTATGCNWGVAGRGNHPINCVDWSQARAYCQSLGGALPTEAQWEYGARGTDGRTYPWGNAAPSAQLCWSGAGARSGTCPVQTFPTGNSPFGLFDMAGNLLEWTADWYSDYTAAAATDPTGPTSGGARVDRGGGWDATNNGQVRAASRWGDNPTDRYPVRGFRCARAPR